MLIIEYKLRWRSPYREQEWITCCGAFEDKEHFERYLRVESTRGSWGKDTMFLGILKEIPGTVTEWAQK